MSSLGNALAQQLQWFGADEGKNVVESLIKNPALQSRIDTGLTDYDRTKTASSQALDQYIREYLAGGKTATARSEQEQADIDRYYSGDVERQLANLRARRGQAGEQALSRALDEMRRSTSANLVAGPAGSSSYDRRLALRTGADLSLQSLLDNLNQERSDVDYLNRMRLGLTGQRTALADALAARALVPASALKAELGWNLGTMGDLLKLDQANKFYGVKYDPSWSEEVGQHVGDLANAAMQAFSIYSGGMGGMGGGSSAPRMPTTTWSPGFSPTFTGTAPAGGGWSLPSMAPATSFGSFPAFGNTYGSMVPAGWDWRGY